MKAIYKPKGRAGEYAKYACNFYTGCSNDCEYCYCKRGVMSHVWDTKPHLRKRFKDTTDAYGQFIDDVRAHSKELRDGGIFFSFTTDPCLPETLHLTMVCVNYAAEFHDIPCYILTKSAPEKLFRTLRSINYIKDYIAVGFTLTGHDELEPNASPNSERIAAMKRIHEMGIKTFASIEPIISVSDSIAMIEATKGFCDLYRVGLRTGVKKDYYPNGSLHFLYSLLEMFAREYPAKFYLKDSLLERLNISREESFSVNADYNIFNTERYD